MIMAMAVVVLVLASVAGVNYAVNIWLYRPPKARGGDGRPAVAILIPARDEAAVIGQAVDAALASEAVDVEVVVLDDGSTDGTADIVLARASADPRVRLLQGAALPDGWCGKPFACQQLADQTTQAWLLFQDADVRLAPAAARQLVAYLETTDADLVSGVPRQLTGSWGERLLLPLIHFVLLGYLPLALMRATRHSAFAAGCGQLFCARRDAYQRAGGHAAIRATLHDGLQLPTAFRRAGLKTELCDVTALAVCRMYRSSAETWRGLAKNASEGMAAPGRIGVFTLLLGGGQVLPFVLLATLPWLAWPPLASSMLAAAALCCWLPRLDAAWRFRQSLGSALLHPVGVAMLLTIQWQAWLARRRKQPAMWRGRAYQPDGSAGSGEV